MNFQQQDTDCDTMPLKDYEKLVASETKHVQAKVTAAIDKAMETIANKQSELLANIKFDPRKRAAEKMTFELDFKISYPGLLKCQSFSEKNQRTFSVSRIRVVVESGLSCDSKTYRDKNYSGTYSFHSEYNNQPVYEVNFNCKKLRLKHLLHLFCKRNEKTEEGNQLYIWHHTNGNW